MSQAKVDRYKEEKRNRSKIMKKQKREEMFLKIAGTLVAVAFVGWIGFSVYQNVHVESAKTYAIHADALDEYLNNMSAEDETESADAETEGAETEAESQAETETK